MNLHDLSALILVRDFAVKVFDNVYFKMSTDQVRQLRTKIALMDQTILESMLKLDPTEKTAVVKPKVRLEKTNEVTKQLE